MIEQATDEFAELMRRVERGETDAVWQLLEQYSGHLRRHVRRALNRDLRSKFDSVDFVQVVWASFFREPERVRGMRTSGDLLAYLATLARNKVVDEGRRRLRTQKHDIRRDIRIDDLHEDQREALASRDPTPSAVAIFRERWDKLLDNQPPRVRQIVELRFRGASYIEIAQRLQIHERTARRAIERLTEADELVACEAAADDENLGG
ncbi:MAG: sigma-70 family RNA polymerase sigma factor [Pirellulaceae bacterium]|nr:sigma-70 family RNA polymerase sigma factor [Pirellulaceae bacterium]